MGETAFGMRTRKGRVFYVAAEDATGMKSRVKALKLKYDDAPAFALVAGVSDLLTEDSEDLAALKTAVEERRPALIFIDTLAMSFPGLEENTAQGMGRVVKVARELTEHGAAVVLIHHDTKAEGSTPRGHSLLNGALDMALHVLPADDKGIIRCRLTKNRNGPCDRDMAFRIDTVDLGTDDDGDPITAALCDELAPNTVPKAEKLNESEKAALCILGRLIEQNGGKSVPLSEWRHECVEGGEVSGAEKRNYRHKTMTRVTRSLVNKQRIKVTGDHVSLPDSDPPWDDEAAGL